MTPRIRQLGVERWTLDVGRFPNPEKSVLTILAILHKWGIHTLGDLIRLDKEEIRARLGTDAVSLWERARGQSMRFLKFVEPPESFIESFEFEYEIETAEPLLFVLRRFLEQLGLRLGGIYLVAKTLTLRIDFSNKQSYERRFDIPEPTNDVELLFRMLQTHLEDFKSEHPIVAVSLEALPVKPLPQQFGLFETSLRNPNKLYETLARLRALLGSNQIGTPVLEDSYRPDAFRMEPFSWQLPESPALVPPPSGASLRRLRPNPVASILLQAGKPAHLESTSINGSIMNDQGPYVVSGNWWDDKTWARQEWDVELENGMVCRIHIDKHRWKIDGIYD